MPLPPAFDGFVEQSKRVSPTCLFTSSAIATACRRPSPTGPSACGSIRIGWWLPPRARSCASTRGSSSGPIDLPPRTIYDWRHYLAVIQRKPGALRNGAPFAELPDGLQAAAGPAAATPGGDREMVDILALVLQHDEQAVLAAVELALDEGVATKTHVLNLLHRLIDGKTSDGPGIDAPQALTLRREPKANVERYDGLRARSRRPPCVMIPPAPPSSSCCAA